MPDQEIFIVGMVVSSLLGMGLLLSVLEFRRMSENPDRYLARPGWWHPGLRPSTTRREVAVSDAPFSSPVE